MKHTVLIIISLFYYSELISQEDSLVRFVNYQGKLKQTGSIKDNKKNGIWLFYNDSTGVLEKIELYKNDFPSGDFLHFNSNGLIVLKGRYSLKAIDFKKEFNSASGGYIYSYKPLPIGQLLFYNNEGVLIKKEFYSKKGKLLKTVLVVPISSSFEH